MSAALLSLANGTSSTTSAGLRTQLGAEKAQGISAAWQAVFASSHSPADAGGAPPDASMARSDEQPAGPHSQEDRASVPDASAHNEDACLPEAATGIGIGQPRAGMALPSRLAPAQSSPLRSGPPLPVPVHTEAAPMQPATPWRDARGGIDATAQRARDQIASEASARPGLQDPPASLESVSVFIRSDAVDVVVRDADVSDQDALSCAFETARELTGQRTALRRLTVNGRTLYRHEGDDTRRSASTFMFAC